MSQTLPGADIRGFYAALGINLPAGSAENVTVRCFANPEEHRREDRKPSCSVNTIIGAWKCHGCGAEGGAFDAAGSRGHDQRSAMELLFRYGLATPHPSRPRRGAPAGISRNKPVPAAPERHTRSLKITETHVARWHAALGKQPLLTQRLARDRGWNRETITTLELGIARSRITIPVRDEQRRLVGLLRYKPWPPGASDKMRAAAGSRRQLLPHPATEPSTRILLVEGEPDMIAARSHGLTAIAVPGVGCWQPDWAQLLAARYITIVMDADSQGRALAARIAHDLAGLARSEILDLAPTRDDGYDLTDWLTNDPRSALEALQ
jgi:Toprim-like